MTLSVRRGVLLVASLVVMLAAPAIAMAQQTPNPVIYFVGAESVESGGKSFIRYRYDVLNKELFPKELFAAAPSLPPCGTNTKSSRTWVDIFAQDGKRLNGFCALTSPNDLNKIWFALEVDSIPPSWIYIQLVDRQTNTKYKSNLVETTN